MWPLLLVACGTEAPPAEVDLWIADPGANVVFRDGVEGREAALTAQSPGSHPAFDPAALGVVDGRVVVADFATGWVLEADGDGLHPWFLDDPAGELRIEEPCGLVSDDDDGLMVLANDSENIAFLGAGGEVRGELGPQALLRGAHGLAVMDDGALLVVSSPKVPGEPTLRVWDRERGLVLREFGEGLALPTDPLLLGDGTVAVTDWEAGVVVRVDVHRGEIVDLLAEGLDRPVALAHGASEVLVLDQGGVTTLSGEPVVDGEGLVFPRDLLVTPRP